MHVILVKQIFCWAVNANEHDGTIKTCCVDKLNMEMFAGSRIIRGKNINAYTCLCSRWAANNGLTCCIVNMISYFLTPRLIEMKQMSSVHYNFNIYISNPIFCISNLNHVIVHEFYKPIISILFNCYSLSFCLKWSCIYINGYHFLVWYRILFSDKQDDERKSIIDLWINKHGYLEQS